MLFGILFICPLKKLSSISSTGYSSAYPVYLMVSGYYYYLKMQKYFNKNIFWRFRHCPLDSLPTHNYIIMSIFSIIFILFAYCSYFATDCKFSILIKTYLFGIYILKRFEFVSKLINYIVGTYREEFNVYINYSLLISLVYML